MIIGGWSNCLNPMEMERIMKNMDFILEEAGATFKDILKCSVYARNLS